MTPFAYYNQARGVEAQRPTLPQRGFNLQWRKADGRTGQIILPKATFWLGGLALAISMLWGCIMTAFVVFHDDLSQTLAQTFQGTDQGYEDRIANLSGMLDRVTSKQMIEHETLERKVELLLKRQAVIESRQSIVAQVLDSVGLTRPQATGSLPAATPLPMPRDSAVPLRQSALPLDLQIGTLADRLDASEKSGTFVLGHLEEKASAKARRLRSVFAEIGMDMGRLPTAARVSAMGGPYVPLKAGSAFDVQLERLQRVVSEVDGLERATAQLPLQRPVSFDNEQTSGFGPRLDPFMKSWAYHAGLDFRGDTGEPVRATGFGKVVIASVQGGYGNMVEIEHAGGLSTRYGHLSQILVSEGDIVQAGQSIGRLGSTGRSTGPHLHYETRIDGEAIDPTRFLRAGAKLGGL